ncbi:MAG: histidine kinase [Rhodospirillales bacterium]|nr:histidine kinase [Rhodospirillales bacterium]
MTNFLVSEENPEGYKLEDILLVIRKDIVIRCDLIIDDTRPEAEQVISNNIKILNLLTEAIHLAQNSTDVLDAAFGPRGDQPRIGTE